MRPRVVLSAGNIAHYHHAAVALQKAGLLQRYVCTFSGQEADAWWGRLLPLEQRKRLHGKYVSDLDPGLIKTIPTPHITTQVLRRMGVINIEQANTWSSAWYDSISQEYAGQAEVFHHVNSMGLKTARMVHERGGKVICDVRSEHIDTQEAILLDEYSQLGLVYRSPRRAMRDRLIAEYGTADIIIVPSSYVADTFVQQGIDRTKLFIVPYGADLSNFTRWEQQHQDMETERPFRVLFVGQIIPRKGLHHLIRAFVDLRLPHAELLIFGRGEPAYEDLIRKMIPPGNCSIGFMGHVPQIELWRHYSESDVFVLPTLSEGSAVVVYEAMAAGLPVITTPNAGAVARDKVDGFIVPIRHSGAILNSLLYLYEHQEERLRMGYAAANQAKEFTWERYGERLLAVYAEFERAGLTR